MKTNNTKNNSKHSNKSYLAKLMAGSSLIVPEQRDQFLNPIFLLLLLISLSVIFSVFSCWVIFKLFGGVILLILLSIYFSYVIYREISTENKIQWKNDSRAILLYDGVCNMCNGVVNFTLNADKKEIFDFASLQSEYCHDLLNKLNIKNDFNTVILIENENKLITTKSTAALRVAKLLGYPYNVLYFCAIIIPTPLRNFAYAMVASSRYLVFGKSEICQRPTPKFQSRFLDQQKINNVVVDNSSGSNFFFILDQ